MPLWVLGSLLLPHSRLFQSPSMDIHFLPPCGHYLHGWLTTYSCDHATGALHITLMLGYSLTPQWLPYSSCSTTSNSTSAYLCSTAQHSVSSGLFLRPTDSLMAFPLDCTTQLYSGSVPLPPFTCHQRTPWWLRSGLLCSYNQPPLAPHTSDSLALNYFSSSLHLAPY